MGSEARSLTRHRTILQFRIDWKKEGAVTFEQVVDDVEDRTILAFTMERSVWVEMGQPQVITLSVEPGDLLNTDEVAESVTPPESRLGLATTLELIRELVARAEVDKTICDATGLTSWADYSTVGHE